MKKEQKQITAALEQDFCKLIVILAARSGKNKVTWKELEQETGFTRQALSRKEAIVKAYKEANQSSSILEDISKRTEETQSKLDKIKEENIKLKRLLADYDETFVRWFVNATGRGMSLEQLEAPLPYSMKTKARLKDIKK
ncbi:hypothetical protein [Aeromonas hydrophila]|uniref:Uncharacterized protein n=1 Tax=Aeromonas hydrophila TaxID=644 RepID=A0ABD7G5V0_AERHY|nr:hypothetical protein [Aeromonas hydrophila]MBC8673371.1 hypothetical protein [Aeromonas hydrophila]MBC8689224.1 hypothetical protein [Aeromonas hydrophila]MCZ4335111.1 hypothetical protein [Aeromonas hydrophila]RCF47970.1 hypothetical protein C6C11_15505 [Aeromonas hydrophila]TNH84642.1 hypothetical protein CF138_12500 [Aeromonas hydrophila]